MHPPYVAVFDFGSQTTKLIARRVRELGVFSKIMSPHTQLEDLREHLPGAIILSGGPQSLTDEGAVRLARGIFELNIPLLGICYGMQLMMEYLGYRILKASSGEFGKRTIEIHKNSLLFDGITGPASVWMSHFDQAHGERSDLSIAAHSESCAYAAIEIPNKQFYGVQFHPEVSHSEHGQRVLSNFLFRLAGLAPTFDLGHFLQEKISEIKEIAQHHAVIMGLSGGVDSSVAAALIHKAIGDKLHCIYVDNGLTRHQENEAVKELASSLGLNLRCIDARDQFLGALSGIQDPEQKRKIIGHTFINVFEREAKCIEGVRFLGQGTLYPDVIESGGSAFSSQVIKSHHNVGGLPERMQLTLIEPLSELFKDEVRIIGAMLGLPKKLIERQPFPGPGLAVRMPGPVSFERLQILRHADAIVREVIDDALARGDIPNNLWQWFAILLPVQSVGVMGDARVLGETIVIRCVESSDAMTADWARLSPELLGHLSSRITNEVLGISRVLYDITQKPPGTIEWE